MSAEAHHTAHHARHAVRFALGPVSYRAVGWSEVGEASWYGGRDNGHMTAFGERFDQRAMTCAHPILPGGTRLLIRNLENGFQAICRVNDRGPVAPDAAGRPRIVDASFEVARVLGYVRAGHAQVRVTVLPAQAAWESVPVTPRWR